MRLHVACLPFPSYQGTQAAIGAMLRASAEAGRPTHLLTYAHGTHAPKVPYQVHRIPDFPKVRSLRSGPSLGKVALDLRCIAAIRRLARRRYIEVILAHHIEAALAAIVADVAPVCYVAHTALSRELPVYFPRLPERPVSALGHWLEQVAIRKTAATVAIAPSLATLLDDGVAYLPVPWAPAPSAPTRDEARSALRIPLDAEVCLYAGNLDRYQGWEHLVDALAELRLTHDQARLLVATESDPTPVTKWAARLGIAEAVDVRRLAGEQARAHAHAASDLTWVPRRTEGGLPIKMLDAFGRGLPVVAMELATAGLPIEGACEIVPNDDGRALASKAASVLRQPATADRLRERGARYLSVHHSAEAFTKMLDRVIGTKVNDRPATPRAPRPRAARERRAR